jgi:hypothetical protein
MDNFSVWKKKKLFGDKSFTEREITLLWRRESFRERILGEQRLLLWEKMIMGEWSWKLN